MQTIKNTISFAALIGGLFVCFNTTASAQFVPSGSYQKSCVADRTMAKDSTLYANCATKGNLVGQKQFPQSSLEYYFLCDGDIRNEDGKLQCSKNYNSPLMLKAKSAIDASYQAITNSKIKNNGEYMTFINLMFRSGLSDKFFSGTLSSSTNQISENWLSAPARAELRAQVIDQAFRDVYNYGASPKDVAFWNAQKVGYQKIINAESKKLNSDKVIRRMMIFAAYKKAMGRNATESEVNYWMPKAEYFKQIVDASRAYLYTPSGAKDLSETVKRALKDKSSNDPTITEINQAIVKHSKIKSIYSEM